jgi:hypothetical protein
MAIGSQKFVSRWWALTWRVTVLVTAILAVVTVAVALELGRLEPNDGVGRVWLIGALLIAPSILILAALFAPLGYELTPSDVVVRRLGPAAVQSLCSRRTMRAVLWRPSVAQLPKTASHSGNLAHGHPVAVKCYLRVRGRWARRLEQNCP